MCADRVVWPEISIMSFHFELHSETVYDSQDCASTIFYVVSLEIRIVSLPLNYTPCTDRADMSHFGSEFSRPQGTVRTPSGT